MKKIQGVLAVLFVVSLLISVAYAVSEQGGQGNAGMPPPPPGNGNVTGGPGGPGGSIEFSPIDIPESSIAVCSGKAQGSVCKDGNMEGTCDYTPDKKFFACKPNIIDKLGPGQLPPRMGQNSTSSQ